MATILDKRNLMAFIPLACLLFCSCQKALRFPPDPAPNHALEIQFKPIVDADTLVYGNTYHNIFNEPYTVRNFKFYVSQILLTNTDSNITYKVNKDQYFLVDFADLTTAKLTLNAVPYTYNRISFTIGVDSIHNVSGAQTGALDPANGMFWTWNSGYIMAKLEGNSPASNEQNQIFEYHIGGFAGAESVVEQIDLNFPSNQQLGFLPGHATSMTITANTNAWFASPNAISIATTPVCATPGGLAKSIAENYANMFQIINIVNE
jgi:hypothetical protein